MLKPDFSPSLKLDDSFSVHLNIPLRDDLPYWLAMSRIRGVGPARFKTLLETFGSAKESWRAQRAEIIEAGIDKGTTESIIRTRSKVTPDRELEILNKLGITALTWCDDAYPFLLRHISDPPPVLFMKGTLQDTDRWAIGVVGTRMLSSYGKYVTQHFTSQLSELGITIISGLARGADTVAHKAAITAGGRTIAVLGCGLDFIYPPENKHLSEEIIEHGALITEFPVGIKPEPGNFPARNRLISGLSLGILVTEAPERSGALITARFAGEQGRDVFAVPSNLTSKTGMGTNRLLQDGAKVVLDVSDILEELNLNMVKEEARPQLPISDDPVENTLLSILSLEPVHIDEICRATQLAAADVSSALTLMELKGWVRHLGGMQYILAR